MGVEGGMEKMPISKDEISFSRVITVHVSYIRRKFKLFCILNQQTLLNPSQACDTKKMAKIKFEI